MGVAAVCAVAWGDGVGQSYYSVKPWSRAGLEFVFMGASVAITAYAIGWLVSWIGQRYLQKFWDHHHASQFHPS